jgi:polysaccharide biosynthesis/export protein
MRLEVGPERQSGPWQKYPKFLEASSPMSLFCRAGRGFLALVLAAAMASFGLTAPAHAQAIPDAGQQPLMPIGVGDTITIAVYDQPDMTATVYVSDDGTVPVALAGAVHVAGLSPAGAAQAIEKALRDGHFFKKPHVTITVVQSRSQRVSVLGEVGSPGRYPIDSKTTIFDLLAQAGGAKDTAATTIYLLRTGKDGNTARYPIDLRVMADNSKSIANQSLQGSDSIFVPKAEEFYIYGEVSQPNKYRLEPGMTIVQAIIRAGGITARGSRNRVEVKRKGPNGEDVLSKGKLDEVIQPNDVIRVKESIF